VLYGHIVVAIVHPLSSRNLLKTLVDLNVSISVSVCKLSSSDYNAYKPSLRF